MTLNALMAALVAELVDGEIPNPLAERFTLANVWADLARLAGEEVPTEALTVIGVSLAEVYEPIGERRGSFADAALQFAPAD